MDKKLEGKTAIITGCDSVIGQAIALEFAQHGANVVINYLYNEDGAQQTFHQVKQQGQPALVVQADMSHEEQVEALFDSAIGKFGEIYILVNSAGGEGAGLKVAELPTEQWHGAFATSVDSYFFCARRFVNHRTRKGGKGKIINVTSVHERLPHAGAAASDSTSGAILNLSRTLALEVAATGICVNNLAAGLVLPPLNPEDLDNLHLREKQVQNVPMKRAARPQEIAKLALFLATSDSDYCTGATFTMDGALSLSLELS